MLSLEEWKSLPLPEDSYSFYISAVKHNSNFVWYRVLHKKILIYSAPRYYYLGTVRTQQKAEAICAILELSA